MGTTAKIVAAAVGGYLLGRKKKLKMAIGLGLYLGAKKLDIKPQQFVQGLVKEVSSLPGVNELKEQSKEQLLDAGKTAAGDLLGKWAGDLAESLNNKAEDLRSDNGGEEAGKNAPEAHPPPGAPDRDPAARRTRGNGRFLMSKVFETRSVEWAPWPVFDEEQIRAVADVLASGRVSRSQAWLAGLLNIRPILGLDHEGGIVPAAKVRGRGNVLPRMLALIEKRVPPDSEPVRFGIIHVGCPEIVPEIRSAIHARYPDAEILTAPAAPALATHIGPGAWGIAFSPLLPSSPP